MVVVKFWKGGLKQMKVVEVIKLFWARKKLATGKESAEILTNQSLLTMMDIIIYRIK